MYVSLCKHVRDVAVCAQGLYTVLSLPCSDKHFSAMDHTLREELAFDISLRALGECLAASWAVRTLPKSVDQHYRQRGLPDPIGYHLHPFVLKVNVEKRELTVGITDCEMAPGNKKKKERKLTGQHVYVCRRVHRLKQNLHSRSSCGIWK